MWLSGRSSAVMALALWGKPEDIGLVGSTWPGGFGASPPENPMTNVRGARMNLS